MIGRNIDTLFGGPDTVYVPVPVVGGRGSVFIPPSVDPIVIPTGLPTYQPTAPVVSPVVPDDDKVVVDSSVDTLTIDMGNPEITEEESPEVREARIAYVKAMR